VERQRQRSVRHDEIRTARREQVQNKKDRERLQRLLCTHPNAAYLARRDTRSISRTAEVCNHLLLPFFAYVLLFIWVRIT